MSREARPRPPGSRQGRFTMVWTVLAVGLAVLAALSRGEVGRPGGWPGPKASGPRLELGPGPDVSGFARATTVQDYRLPADHGPHFEYQTEWWYFTGHLAAEDGRLFGFQLTFFRRGLTPGPPPGGPGLATNQIYFAHFAVTDGSAGEHHFAERWSRGGGELASARGEPFAVWLEDWRVDSRNEDGSALSLVARDGGRGLALDLEARKPLVRHGDRGLSPKSDAPGNASHYVGYTRLGARGELTTSQGTARVAGEGWFDHEWSTSALGPGAVGWDWFSLQLDDGRELMYFQIRREDGGVEPVSGGTWVEGDGATRRLRREDVAVGVLDRWTSPDSGASYPGRWRLVVPGEDLDLQLEPLVADQEVHASFVYWEGAVKVTGRQRGRPVTGRGYVELTGYARSMQGVF